MTHQKVRSQDKWGAIPMSPKIIEEVYYIINTSDCGSDLVNYQKCCLLH
ncbi:DUF6241 domain-containing protein [Peribacillus sp. ACCC06369]|nr:DUF6241 domain-containing protein [Peribacillus sp. ACCC06369]MDM5357214.1 DUF6241 domain-containing protein [Peribacillus sp. ACCC06369]